MAVTYKALKAFRARGITYAVNDPITLTGWSARKISQMIGHRFIIPT